MSSLNGEYEFDNQQYILNDGSSTNHLKLLGGLDKTYMSEGLSNFIEQWVSHLSYQNLSELLKQQTGHHILSDGGIKSYCLRKALTISQEWSSMSLGKSDVGLQIGVKESIDIYDTKQGEVLLMMDDVGVKAQKPHKKIERTKEDAKRIDTTVALISVKEVVGEIKTTDTIADKVVLGENQLVEEALKAIQKAKKAKEIVEKPYITLTQGIDASGAVVYPIEKAISNTLHRLYGVQIKEQPLPVVAITDGARSIRLTLQFLFGVTVCIILDWYHVQLKIKNLMSMIAPNKTLKELYIKDLGALLWRGKTTQALDYLAQIPQVKNQEKFEELVEYLTKHQAEIIDYYKRQQAGKTIGSGRCEKANDAIVAHRQKKKGMAWSKSGSKALAIIKTNLLNKAA